MSAVGGISVPAGRGAWTINGRRDNPFGKSRVRWAKALIGRCCLSGGHGAAMRQSRGTYTEERPLVRCLADSWAL